MSLPQIDTSQSVDLLRDALSTLQAIYLFGSQATGEANAESDVDLAILLPRPLSAAQRWALAGELAERLNREVDLVDLRQASTVLQQQVLSEGRRLWACGSEADEFELMVQSEYWDLAIQRRGLIDDIKQRGSVHGG
ncbi:Predicted nucleotidyltransferase [Halomonas shengliensis]|uniref:Predicted nucleotidyltransferase n=1 Tax=Halomonas shengliensis TaxID=419597 RepID=A0A1H0GUJ0_9GAMM|nr:nucleotidyltransferase domain-containing protein [Halomonas shengliensis]SDO10494.1 Predicted nucleotidyltransferase [Halomonas shengliensis]